MVTTISFSTLQPISVATYSAVSKSIFWLMPAMTPLRIRNLMTSAAVFFMREASSPTVISSGILTVSGAFLAISSCRRRIFSCSSERDLLPANLPFFWFCCFFLVPRPPMRCLPPVKFCSRAVTSTSTRSSKRSAFTVTAEVSTTRRSRLRWGSAGLAGLTGFGGRVSAFGAWAAGWALSFGALGASLAAFSACAACSASFFAFSAAACFSSS